MAAHDLISVEVDADLIEAARSASASHAPLTEADVVEQALRLYVGRGLLEAAQATSDLSDDEADAQAVEELRAARQARRHGA